MPRGFETGSDNEKINELERRLDDINDSQISSVGSNENISIDSTRGSRNAASGDSGGVRSNLPVIHQITDVDSAGSSTGIFDKINLISSMIIVDHTSTPIDLRFIQGTAKDGVKIKITPKVGKTLVIKSGGNILTSSDITVLDTEYYELVKHSEAETGVSGGAYKILLGGAGGGSGNVPNGTVENQHIEWDNTGLKWDAVDVITLGSTGPFASDGFIRFANDQIMLASRNQLDTGNIELKINNGNFIDWTRSDNQPVVWQLRSQHASQSDQIMQMFMFSGTNAVSEFRVPTTLNFFATSVGVFNYNQNRLQMQQNILPNADGTLRIGNVAAPNRFLGMHASEFGFDINRRFIFSTGGLTLNLDGSGDQFVIGIDSSQRALFTSTLTQLTGNVSILGNLSVGGDITGLDDLTFAGTGSLLNMSGGDINMLGGKVIDVQELTITFGRILSTSAIEFGIQLDNVSATVGSAGMLAMPQAIPPTVPTKADLDTRYGTHKGAMGIDTGLIPHLFVRSINGDWFRFNVDFTVTV